MPNFYQNFYQAIHRVQFWSNLEITCVYYFKYKKKKWNIRNYLEWKIYLAGGLDSNNTLNRVSWYIISDSLCRHRNSILFESNRPVFRKWMRGQWGRVLLWISRHPGWRGLPATTSTVNLPGGTMVFNGTRTERNVAYWAKLIFQ